MSGLFGLGRKNKNENEVDSTSATGTQSGVGSGANTGYGSTSQRGAGTGSEEAKNLHYEGTTASGARSGRTGATSQLDSGAGAGAGTGTGTGTRSGTGIGTGTTGTSGISEGFRGMNLTHQSGYEANHPVVGDSTIVCDTKYYTAIEDRPVIKEIKTYIREHHPIEKEFVVETRPTGQEREQDRTSEVVNTRESIIETTPADPCGGVPTSQYNAGTSGTGTGITGSRGATTGTGYGTGAGVGTGSGVGSGTGTGAGGRTIT